MLFLSVPKCLDNFCYIYIYVYKHREYSVIIIVFFIIIRAQILCRGSLAFAVFFGVFFSGAVAKAKFFL